MIDENYDDLEGREQISFTEDINIDIKYMNIDKTKNLREIMKSLEETMRLETDEYDLILGKLSESIGRQIILFNHGIFVGMFYTLSLSWPFIICVNAKKDLFDLQISRENIIVNERWLNFLYSVGKKLIDEISSKFLEKDQESYLNWMSTIFNNRFF